MKGSYSDKGMSKGSFNLKDNQHASPVRSLPSDSQKEGNKGLKELPMSKQGYPAQAFGYKY